MRRNICIKPVDNSLAGHLGFRPEDNTDRFRDKVEAASDTPDPKAPATIRLGGWFMDLPHPDDDTDS